MPEKRYPSHWTAEDITYYERGGDPDITGGAILWAGIGILAWVFLIGLLIWVW